MTEQKARVHYKRLEELTIHQCRDEITRLESALQAANERIKELEAALDYQQNKYAELDTKPSDFQIIENQLDIISKLTAKLERAKAALRFYEKEPQVSWWWNMLPREIGGPNEKMIMAKICGEKARKCLADLEREE